MITHPNINTHIIPNTCILLCCALLDKCGVSHRYPKKRFANHNKDWHERNYVHYVRQDDLELFELYSMSYSVYAKSTNLPSNPPIVLPRRLGVASTLIWLLSFGWFHHDVVMQVHNEIRTQQIEIEARHKHTVHVCLTEMSCHKWKANAIWTQTKN